jgi:acetyltransferase
MLTAAKSFTALDTRTVHWPARREVQLPRVAALRYPIQYVRAWTLPDGTWVTIRPICPEDEWLLREFHERLSDDTVYLRYLHMIQLDQRVAHESLSRLCCSDFDREMALVAEGWHAASGRRAILAMGRLSRMPTLSEAECDLLVDDAYQRHGLGTELLRRLIEVGRAEGVRCITAVMLRDNQGMQRTCQKLGFQLNYVPEDQVMVATVELSSLNGKPGGAFLSCPALGRGRREISGRLAER